MSNKNRSKPNLPKFLSAKNLKVELDERRIASLDKYLPDQVKEDIVEFVNKKRKTKYVAIMPMTSETGEFACDYFYIRPYDSTMDESFMFVSKAIPRDTDHSFDYVSSTYESF